MSRKEEWLEMIDDCEVRESRLTEWEINFIESVANHLGDGRDLTPKQEETLENIWEKTTKRGQTMADIDLTLKERGNRYGDFYRHAKITQDIKRAMKQGNWEKLEDDQKECLEMIAHKIGRILNGDPNYHDSWHDIVGYTKLVADRIENK